MKETLMSIVDGALGTISKGLRAMDCGIIESEFELALLRSLSDKYSRENA